jgi:hypothetical protein
MKCSNWFVVATLLALLPTFASAETHVPAGPISGTWTLSGSPYYIEGNVLVNSTSILIIQPGVDVLFLPGCRFRIEGQLVAIGTPTDSIIFTATDTTWGSEGLHFLNINFSGMDSSRLEYCIISYGVGSPVPDPYMHGGGIYINNSSELRISHCLITRCRTMDVVGANGAPGQPGGGDGGAGGTISSGNGGAIFCNGSNPVLSLNIFTFNSTGAATGGNGGNGGNSSDWGGDGGAGGSANSGSGVAIYLMNSSASIVQNIFQHNSTGIARGGIGGNGGNGFSSEEGGYGGNGGSGGNGSGGNGGALAISQSNAYLFDNQISDNSAGNAYGNLGGYGGSGDWIEAPGHGGSGGSGGNGYGGSGGAISSENSQSVLADLIVFQNKAGNGYGGQGGHGGSSSSYGAGGTGGSGYGGSGYAMSAMPSSRDAISNSTFSRHTVVAIGQAGAGGLAGNGSNQAPSGQSYNGGLVIAGPQLSIINSIAWDNVIPPVGAAIRVTYSSIQGGFPGTGNLNVDPFFVNPSLGNFCLSQIGSGQPQQSSCVNAGNPATTIFAGTTRTDGVQDSGVIDMGYHYLLNTSQTFVTLDLQPHNPPILIPRTGGSFQFDVEITGSASFTGVVDLWGVITLPDSTPMVIWQRNNLNIPANCHILRPNLTQNIPGFAPSGAYVYTVYMRDHVTWQTLASDYFTFTKSATAEGNEGIGNWAMSGWDEVAEVPLPRSLTVSQVYPNPFNPSTNFQFTLFEAANVTLEVFDISGRRVGVALVLTRLEAGDHSITFDGSKLPSGVYIYRLNLGEESMAGKLILQK